MDISRKYAEAPETTEGAELQRNVRALDDALLVLSSWYEKWDAMIENWAWLDRERNKGARITQANEQASRPDIARIMKLSHEIKTKDGQMPYARDHVTGALAYAGHEAHNPAALAKPCTGACPGTEALGIIDQLLSMDKALLAEYKRRDEELTKAESDENTWINEGDRERVLGKITFERCNLAQLIARLYGDTRYAEVSSTMQSFLIKLHWRKGELERAKTAEAANELYTSLKRIVGHSWLSGDKALDRYRQYTEAKSPTKVDILAYNGNDRITKAVDIAYRALLTHESGGSGAAFGALSSRAGRSARAVSTRVR
jgi:hypothetical protein